MSHRKPHRTCPPPLPALRGSCSTPIFQITSAAPQGGVEAKRFLAVSHFLRLAVRGRERLGFVHARAPAMHLCGHAFPFTQALPTHPLQRLGKRRAAGARRLLPGDELADGEVRLLLAGARPAESHAQDLHGSPAGAGALRPAPNLAPWRDGRPGQERPFLWDGSTSGPRSEAPRWPT
jgi:hypothetical protein